MIDENVGGLVELPPLPLPYDEPRVGYSAREMQSYAASCVQAALSAHGQPVVDEDVAEEGGFFHLDDLARAIEKLGWRTSDFEALTAALGDTP